MNQNQMIDILAAHADELAGRPGAVEGAGITVEEQGQLIPLFHIAERLQQSIRPVQPSTRFVRSLGKELVNSAQRQVVLAQRTRRGVLIGAAAVGSLVSIASIVGAIVYVVSRSRARQHTHAPAS